MREIKFRAKRRDGIGWVEGLYIETPLTAEVIAPVEDGHYFLTGTRRYCISKDGCVHEVYRESLCESTGLKDGNGVEIYEGDIIALTTADNEDITIICKFGTVQRQIFENLVEITGFYFERSNDGRKTFPIVHNYLGKHDTEIWNVIGNVYDNPEYLRT